ncbi:FAD-dependent oxidoreductase [Desulfovibrio sp. OttesenSCG-928-C14]|nr:FAD-dependent oxidoreductase [Desulfovibrio sp. OttesenSCG-928-C14]
MTYDLIVIGAGAGGTHAAFKGVEHGLKTMLIESGFVGGTCINSGCIPTKLLLGGTASEHLFATQKKFRCAEGEISFSLPALQERKDRYLKALRGALEKRLTDSGVELVHGRASFSGKNSLAVKTKEGMRAVQFKHCIIATGSAPATFPGLVPDGANVLSSTGALNLKEVPGSLIIVGGGVIGLELGDFYKRLGAKITVVEVMPRIALSEDAEVSAALTKQLTREGWKIHTGRKVTETKSTEGGAVLRFEDGEELNADKIMIAVGRRPGAKQLQPQEAGIETAGPGWIVVDENLLAAENIYAIGDCNRRVLLAHAAEHQAEYAVRRIAGKAEGPYDDFPMPSCIYGSNEIMHVGKHAEDLVKEFKPQGKAVAVSYCQLVSNPIAQSYGTNQGWVKITWVDDRIYSVAAWGHGVSHMLPVATVMVKQHWKSDEIIFAHPTLEEALKSAVLGRKELL